jgi:ATP-binding cassette subfamily B protein
MLVTTTPRLMLTVAGIIVLVVLPAVLISRRVRKLSRASQDRIADTSGIAGEILNAISWSRAILRRTPKRRASRPPTRQAFATSIRRSGTRSALTAFVIIGVFGSLLYGLYGGVQAVLAGEISAGQLSQTALYVMVVAGSVAVLAEVWGDLLRASGATERLMELLSRARRLPSRHCRSLAAPAAVCRSLSSGVRFAYPSRPAQPVLQGLDLTIEAGQTVALVGPSGAGKTTVFQLLQRFYDVGEGVIRIDGIDLRARAWPNCGARIAVVPQEAVIFSGSIADNIRYGDPRPATETGRRGRGFRRRIRAATARGLRDFRRRARRSPVGRPAPANRHRARDPQERAAVVARRSDEQPRRGKRARRAGRAGGGDGRAHDDRHRPSPGDRAARRPDHRPRPRTADRCRHAPAN